MPTVGDRVKRARTDAGLTQAALASLAGVTGAQISRLESGQRQMGPKSLSALARVLGVRIDWLMYGAGPMCEAQGGSAIEKAVEFLRGELPDDYLNDALHSRWYGGDAYSKDALVSMLRIRYSARSGTAGAD